MRVTICSIVLLMTLTTVSVDSFCLVLKCKRGFVQVGDACRPGVGKREINENELRTFMSEHHRFARNVADDAAACYGSNKIFINDNVLNNPGSLSTSCPDGYFFNSNMQCQVEGWEPNSGPWETHHYNVRGRNLVLTIKRSDQSVRFRSLSLD